MDRQTTEALQGAAIGAFGVIIFLSLHSFLWEIIHAYQV
jgi:hypothetical protein